jgi:hypothetical protein
MMTDIYLAEADLKQLADSTNDYVISKERWSKSIGKIISTET